MKVPDVEMEIRITNASWHSRVSSTSHSYSAHPDSIIPGLDLDPSTKVLFLSLVDLVNLPLCGIVKPSLASAVFRRVTQAQTHASYLQPDKVQ
jgi:hypothetical protein